ncbi:hypothetical protein ABOM_008344 [Aspergillus bombycis]|uniref:DUF7703 domain-containing protein n=1 Tax=Aspergillus bombycis TaxID=109264 RepID=A0A1F7ZSV4_9EURO|nr:hypothetical protein ABOM_008344 [Aspergillus bombycis]OGM42497.1 hypothetical protein ABOM_008344 [Aspergillus bombycis]
MGSDPGVGHSLLTTRAPDDELHPKNGSLSAVEKYIISVFVAIAWYNAAELIVFCLSTFKSYRGCYFWSLFIASLSLFPICLGYIFYIFYLGIPYYLSISLIIVSWSCMVTGHSLILWSRLHLIIRSPRVLNLTLAMIILDGIVLHTSTAVLLYGGHSHNAVMASRSTRGYNIMERVQLVVFCVQELLISGIYLWETAKMLRLHPSPLHYKILSQFLVINIFIIILDVAVVGIQFAGYYAFQVTFKPVAYSLKFKLEYAILGRLIALATSPSNSEPFPSSSLGSTGAVESWPVHGRRQRVVVSEPSERGREK